MEGTSHDNRPGARAACQETALKGTPDVTGRFRETACRVVSLHGEGERAANEIAARQRSLITARQARAAGIGRKAVATRLRAGTWQQVQRGVYSTDAGDPPPATLILAAVLACRSPGAVGSHLSAAWLWRMLDRWPGVTEITALGGRNPGALTNVRIHRTRRATAIRWQNGIPLTSPLDTLFDIAPLLAHEELESAIARTTRAGLMSRTALLEAVAAARPRPGISKLREAAADPRLTRSKNERGLVKLLRAAELIGYDTNVVIEGKEIDVYFPTANLAIEMDAYATHGDEATFEDDRRLDADFEAAGIKLMRFTGRRLRTAPEAVLARIVGALVLRLGELPIARRR